MAKIIINDLLDETSFLSDANERFQQIEDEFNEKVLYRDNPEGEPNQMDNDFDMDENDIINVKKLTARTVEVNGKPIDGSAPTWGPIEGDIEDQEDLEARLQQAEKAGIHTLNIGEGVEGHLSDYAFEVLNKGDGEYTFQYTDRVNARAFGAVRLNQAGKIPFDLLALAPTDILGFMRGDNTCPKPIDDAGIPGIPVTPCTEPDYRNPSELLGDEIEDPENPGENIPIWKSGHTWIMEFELPETDGMMNLISRDDPTGPDVPIEVNSGDAVIYIEELRVGDVLIARAGWHKWEQAVAINTALATSFNTNNVGEIIQPESTNVQVALEDVEDGVVEHISDMENPHGVTIAQIGAEPANVNIQAHIAQMGNNPHAVTKDNVGLGNADNTSDVAKPISAATEAALGEKITNTSFTSQTVAGVVKMHVTPTGSVGPFTLTISTNADPA